MGIFLGGLVGRITAAAERLVGLQSAPSIAMAVPWSAEEARLYPKYDLDFQLVYIASSGIVTAAMSSGNGSVNSAPSGTMTSPCESSVGVDAMP